MARRRRRSRTIRSGGQRRDWRKIGLYAFSLAICLSMVLSLFASLLTF